MRFIIVEDENGEEWLVPLKRIKSAGVSEGKPWILTKGRTTGVDVKTPLSEIAAKIKEASK